MSVASPCDRTCQLHPVTGWCLGCQRSGDEIARWTVMDDAERHAILADRARRASVPKIPGPAAS